MVICFSVHYYGGRNYDKSGSTQTLLASGGFTDKKQKEFSHVGKAACQSRLFVYLSAGENSFFMKQKVFEVRKIAPTHIPFKCPICNGYGTLGRHPNMQECHGCDGTGIVVVEQNYGIDASDVV